MWETPAVVFKVGDNIETIIVAANTNPNKPYYASGTNDIRFNNPTNGTIYTVTVVPKLNYKLGSWSTNATNTGLASQTLLTTTYTVNGSETLTATGAYAPVGATGAYTNMKDLTLANCSTSGTNVIDERNGRSYTVQKLTSGSTQFCFMLSNLRLDGGTELSSSNSHVSSTYTLPTDASQNGWTNDYCRPYMIHYNQVNTSDGSNEYRNEYYYNWPAATARNNSSNTSSCSNDTSNSLGDICPANWSIPADGTGALQLNNDTFRTTLLNSKSLATSGFFYSGTQYSVGSSGYWWSSTRYSDSLAYYLYLYSGSAYRFNGNKYLGFSVRCMRSS